MSSTVSWLTNSALVRSNAGGGGLRIVSANEYSCGHVAQINFENLTPYLTYELEIEKVVVVSLLI
jgi:hypothetical protein